MKRSFLFLLFSIFILNSSVLFCDLQQYEEREPVPGETIIRFSYSIDSLEIQHINGHIEIGIPWFDSLSAHFGIYELKKLFPYDHPVLSRIWKVKFPKVILINDVTSAFSQIEDVDYSEGNGWCHGLGTPNDPYFPNQWAYTYLDAENAWDIQTGDPNVIIGHIDSGVDTLHPELVPMFWHDSQGYIGFDFYRQDRSPDDEHGHGTHTAGIAAAATNNGIGVSGTAGGWNGGGIRLMILKVIDETNYTPNDRFALAIYWAAAHGAKILTMSIGGYCGGIPPLVIKDAIDFAYYDEGCVVVVAAGNDNTNLPMYPAYFDECIAVGSTNFSDKRSFFSQFGDWVDVSAPGGTDNPIDEDDILSTTPTYENFYAHTHHPYLDTWYDYWGGTSMACPYVSGLAGLILSQYPGLTNKEVRERLLGTVDIIHYFYDQAFDSLGTGRINAYKALTMPEGPNIVFYGDTIMNSTGGGNKRQAYVGLNNMVVCLGNLWKSATGVNATLLSADPYVTILSGQHFYGIMKIYEHKFNDIHPFVFRVLPDCPQGHIIHFQLYVTADGGYAKTIDFDVTVGIPFQSGFPADLGLSSNSSPAFADLDNNGFDEIVATAAVSEDNSKIYAIKYDGTIIWEYSLDGGVVSIPAIGDIDNDGSLDCVVFTADKTNRGFHIYGFNFDGTPKFDKFIDTYHWYTSDISCPTLTNLDQDEDLEIIVGTNSILPADKKIIAFNYDGTNLVNLWERTVDGAIICSPAVGDLNGDRIDDIVFGTTSPGGYKFYGLDGTNGQILSDNWEKDMVSKTIGSPAIGDIDNDGQYEIIAVTSQEDGGSGKAIVWNSDGTELWDFYNVNSRFYSSPALADFILDSYLGSVIIDGYFRNRIVYRLDETGNVLSEYPMPGMRTYHNAHSDIRSSPVIGDLNADATSDLLIPHPTIFYEYRLGGPQVKSQEYLPLGNIFAVSSSGDLLPAYPLETKRAIIGCPALLDFDNDKDIEIVVCSEDGKLYVWDCDTPFDPSNVEWQMFQHDIWHTGRYDLIIGNQTSSSSYATAFNEGKKLGESSDGNDKFWIAYESGGKIYSNFSKDKGKTWTKKRISSTQVKDCGFSAMAFDNSDNPCVV